MNTWSSESYLRHASFVPQLGQALLELLAPQPGERILDVGCGEGTLTQQLATCGAIVVGIDNSPTMVEAARARGVDVRLIDAEALTFEDEFDAVFSNAALHWVTDHDALLAGIVRSLRPHGRFVAEFGGHGNIAAIQVAVRAVLERRNLIPPRPRYYPTVAEYTSRLVTHGFIVEQISLIPRPTPLPTGIRGWLQVFERSTLDRLGPDAELALDEMESLLRPSLCDTSGHWTADYVRLRFRAKRREGPRNG
ncbi:MAG TPA: methyltransferase domain-containing protein [Vicinamibacterales bacterium]|nr:methyltransferase domain-containing protein [Vicinamibacterales bacterium]